MQYAILIYGSSILLPHFSPMAAGEGVSMSPNSTTTGLPPQRTGFIGRSEEVETAVRLLTEPDTTLVTITGPGGIGKTRIAIEAARRSSQAFPDGIGFVPLEPVDSPGDIVHAILSALRLELHTSSEPMVENLAEHLSDRALLLLLDSFEHLMAGAGLVSALLQSTPAVRILVTSHQPLGLPGERILEVEGLACPGGPEDDGAALEFFQTCARRVLPGFELTWDMEPLVVGICRRVDGNPLAIELAASWLRNTSLAEICLVLENDITSLATDSLEMPERHRSLIRIIEHSWSLLAREERRTLEELSVFRGGFTSDAAAKVSETDRDTLSALAVRSLIRREAGGRYGMHEVARQYGQLRLGEDRERENSVRSRHATYFIALLRELEPYLEGGDKKALNQLVPDLDNIRSAWKWAVDTSSIDLIAEGLLSVYTLYTTKGWYREGAKLLSDALDGLDRINRRDSGAVLAVGRLRLRLGWLEVCLGNYSRAGDLISESLTVFSEVGDRGLESAALYYLSSLSLFGGDCSRADELARRSLDRAQEAGDHKRMGLAWMAIGNVARRRGAFVEAGECYTESLSVFERTGDEGGRSVALGNLGIVAYRLDEPDRALELSMQSLAIVEEIGDQRLIAETCCDLGNVYRKLGRFEEAGNCYARSLGLNRELGIRSGTAIALINVSHYEKLRGNPGKAIRCLEEAYDIAMNIGRIPIAMQTLNVRGWMDIAQDNTTRARQYFIRGLRLFEGPRVMPVVLNLLSGIALILASEGSRDRAISIIGFIMGSGCSPGAPSGRTLEAIAALDPPASDEEMAAAILGMNEIQPSELVREVLEEAD